jgi:DNA-binding transcriptional regulator WhiA
LQCSWQTRFEDIGILWDTKNEPWKSSNLEMANIFKDLSVSADDKFYQWYLKYHYLYVNELLDREKLRTQKPRFSSCIDVVNSDSHKPESDGSSQIVEV